MPESDTEATVGVTLSERLTSVTVSVPARAQSGVGLDQRPGGAVAGANCNVGRVICVPVMVTVTVWMSLPPWPSFGLDRIGQRQRLAHRQEVEDLRARVERPVQVVGIARIVRN